MFIPPEKNWRLPPTRLDVNLDEGTFGPIGCTWADVLHTERGGAAKVKIKFLLHPGEHALAQALEVSGLVDHRLGNLAIRVDADRASWCSIKMRLSGGKVPGRLSLARSRIKFMQPYPKVLNLGTTGLVTSWQRAAVAAANSELVGLTLDADGQSGSVNLLYLGRPQVVPFPAPGLGLYGLCPGTHASPLDIHQHLGPLCSLMGKLVADDARNYFSVELKLSDQLPWTASGQQWAVVLPAVHDSATLRASGSLSAAPHRNGVRIALGSPGENGIKGDLPGSIHLTASAEVTLTATLFEVTGIDAALHGVHAEAFILGPPMRTPVEGQPPPTAACPSNSPEFGRDMYSCGLLSAPRHASFFSISGEFAFGPAPHSTFSWRLSDSSLTGLRISHLCFDLNGRGKAKILHQLEGTAQVSGSGRSHWLSSQKVRLMAGSVLLTTENLRAPRVSLSLYREPGGQAVPIEETGHLEGEAILMGRLPQRPAHLHLSFDTDAMGMMRLSQVAASGRVSTSLANQCRLGPNFIDLSWGRIEPERAKLFVEGDMFAGSDAGGGLRWTVSNIEASLYDATLLLLPSDALLRRWSLTIWGENNRIRVSSAAVDSEEARARYLPKDTLFGIIDGSLSPMTSSAGERLSSSVINIAGTADVSLRIAPETNSFIALTNGERRHLINTSGSLLTMIGARIPVLGPLFSPNFFPSNCLTLNADTFGGMQVSFVSGDAGFNCRILESTQSLLLRQIPIGVDYLISTLGILKDRQQQSQTSFLAARLFPDRTYCRKDFQSDLIAIHRSSSPRSFIEVSILSASNNFSTAQTFLTTMPYSDEQKYSLTMDHQIRPISNDLRNGWGACEGRHYSFVVYAPLGAHHQGRVDLNVAGAFRSDACIPPGGTLRTHSQGWGNRVAPLQEDIIEAYIPPFLGGTSLPPLFGPERALFVTGNKNEPQQLNLVACHSWLKSFADRPQCIFAGERRHDITTNMCGGPGRLPTRTHLALYEDREKTRNWHRSWGNAEEDKRISVVSIIHDPLVFPGTVVNLMPLSDPGQRHWRPRAIDIPAGGTSDSFVTLDVAGPNGLQKKLGVIHRINGSHPTQMTMSLIDLSQFERGNP